MSLCPPPIHFPPSPSREHLLSPPPFSTNSFPFLNSRNRVARPFTGTCSGERQRNGKRMNRGTIARRRGPEGTSTTWLRIGHLIGKSRKQWWLDKNATRVSATASRSVDRIRNFSSRFFGADTAAHESSTGSIIIQEIS